MDILTYGISLFTIIKSIKINYFYAQNKISFSFLINDVQTIIIENIHVQNL